MYLAMLLLLMMDYYLNVAQLRVRALDRLYCRKDTW